MIEPSHRTNDVDIDINIVSNDAKREPIVHQRLINRQCVSRLCAASPFACTQMAENQAKSTIVDTSRSLCAITQRRDRRSLIRNTHARRARAHAEERAVCN